MRLLSLIAALLIWAVMPAHARLVTVSTAAGIDITVSETFAPHIVAFIADLVATGYRPRQIRCYARYGHVHGSRHYSGNACDIDQRAYGKTAARMYHVTALAKQHGLRDGGAFRDWGHIDDGRQLTRVAHANRPGNVSGRQRVAHLSGLLRDN